jgi:prophage regulatory protein
MSSVQSAPGRKSRTLHLPADRRSQMVRLPEVSELVGLGSSTIRAKVAEGPFPTPVRIGARAIAWRLSDVEQYLAERPTVGASTPGDAQGPQIAAPKA